MSIIIDIETNSRSESELSGLIPEFEANKTFKDPEKIKLDLENKKQKWMEDGALHAERGTVLCAGLLDSKSLKITILQGEEKDIINVIWLAYDDTTDCFVGHNIKGFDIPFLIRRSWILGIKLPLDLMKGRYLNERFLDTMDRWSCGTKDMISLDLLSKALGLKGKNGSGKDFAGQYLLGGEYKKRAIEYLENDLILTKSVAERMGLII